MSVFVGVEMEGVVKAFVKLPFDPLIPSVVITSLSNISLFLLNLHSMEPDLNYLQHLVYAILALKRSWCCCQGEFPG